MSEAMPCKYCGTHSNGHLWAGSGSCPGAVKEALPSVEGLGGDTGTLPTEANGEK